MRNGYIFLAACGVWAAIFLVSYLSYKGGYNQGFDRGIVTTLDTVNSILAKQVGDSATVTKMTILHPDTNTYFLSATTLSKKP